MLHYLFENASAAHKNKVALSYQNETMSYEELNARSNQLAHELIENGVACETKVAILMDRSFEVIVAIMAVLKAGGAYVPIDPEYPNQLIEYMLSDSASQILLMSSKENALNIETNDIKKIYVNQKRELNIKNPNVKLPNDALAYIIYTSGSTGSPKGVMVEHRNVVSLLNSSTASYTSSDIWTLFHSISFDFSVWEIFGALTTGAELVIVPDDVRKNYREFRKLLIENKVTILNQTPSSFYSFQKEELKMLGNFLTWNRLFFEERKLARYF